VCLLQKGENNAFFHIERETNNMFVTSYKGVGAALEIACRGDLR